MAKRAPILHAGDIPTPPTAAPLPGWLRFQWVYLAWSPLSQRNCPVSLMSCRAVQKNSPSQPKIRLLTYTCSNLEGQRQQPCHQPSCANPSVGSSLWGEPASSVALTCW